MRGAEAQVLVVVFTVWLPAQEVNVGTSVSLTITRKVQVLVRPAASVARKVTVVMPFGKEEPEAGPPTWATGGLAKAQLSAPVGVAKVAMPVHCPSVVPMLCVAGQAMVGGVMSS